MKMLLCSVLLLATVGIASAETLTWVGGADLKLGTAANWQDGSGATPASVESGSAFVIANGAAGTLALENDLADGFEVAGFTFSGGSISLDPASGCEANKLKLTGGTKAWVSSAIVDCSVPLELAEGTQSFDVTAAITNTFTGVISGSGSLRRISTGKKVNGAVALEAANTYTGGTSILCGFLIARNDDACGSRMAAVNIEYKAGGTSYSNAGGSIVIDTENFYNPITVPAAGEGTVWVDSYTRYSFNIFIVREGANLRGNISGGLVALRSYALPKDGVAGGSKTRVDSGVSYNVYGDIDCGDSSLSTSVLFLHSFKNTIHLYGKVRARRLADGSPNQGYSQLNTVYFHSADNQLGNVVANEGKYYAASDNVMTGAVLMAGGKSGYTGRGRFYFEGFDQELDRFDYQSGSPLPSDLTIHEVYGSSSKPSTITMRATDDSLCDMKFYNKLSLVWWPRDAYTMSCISNRASTMTGTIAVSNGTFHVTRGYTFRKITGVAVAPGAKLLLDDPEAIDWSLVTRLDLSTGAQVTIPDGTLIDLSKTTVTLDGRQITGYVATDDAPGYVKNSKLAAIFGSSAVRIYSPTAPARPTAATATVTWTAGADADTSMTTAANWDTTPASPAFDGTEQADFATGEKATVTDALSFFGLNLTAADFAFDADGEDARLDLGLGGVTMPSGADAHAYAFDVPVGVMTDCTWRASSANTTLTFNKPFVSLVPTEVLAPTMIFSNGTVTVNATEPGRYSGYVSLVAHTIVSGDTPFGPSTTEDCDFAGPPINGIGPVKAGAIAVNKEAGGTSSSSIGLELRNAIIRKQISLSQSPKGDRNVYSPAGTTNEIANWVKHESTSKIYVDSGSKLVFSGGIYGRGTSQGGGDFVLRNYGETVITNKPYLYSWGKDSINNAFKIVGDADSHLWIHSVSNLLPATLSSYDATTAMGTIDLMADDAIAYDPADTTLVVTRKKGDVGHGHLRMEGPAPSILDLHGHYQHFCALLGMHDEAVIRSDTPATIHFEQITNIYSSAEIVPIGGRIVGPVTLHKWGAKDLVLKNAYESTGDIECTDGKLAFLAGASWLNGTNVTVRGATAEIEIAKGRTFGSQAVVRVEDGGTLTVKSGNQRVAEYWIDGERQENGVYAMPGGGNLTVGPCGLLLLVR